MADDKKMTEQESLDLITNMIQKAKGSYHETGIVLCCGEQLLPLHLW